MNLLLGVVTYKGHKYCLEKFLTRIAELTYPQFDLIFVDNSEDDGEYKNYIEQTSKRILKGKKIRFKVIRDTKKYLNKFEKINGGRLVLKQAVSKADYKYFLHLDSDIIPPVNAIETLLSTEKEIVSGVYLNGMMVNNRPGVFPMAYDFAGENKIRLLNRTEVYTNQIKEIAGAGFGCVLMKTEILKNVKLDNSKFTDDARFFKEVSEQGHKIFLNTAVKCDHINYPLEDPRNIFFKWNHYIPI